MKFARTLGVLALSAFTLAGCDDDDPTGVTVADLEGFWNATQFQYTDATGDYPSFGIDAVSATVGGSVTLDVASNGSFDGTIMVPGLTVNPATGETIEVPIGGTLSLNDDGTLGIDFNAQTEQLGFFGDFDAEYTLSDDVLTFENDDTSFDFPDAVEQQLIGTTRGSVDATLNARFERD